MCGIAGIFTLGNPAPRADETELLRMRESMRARGPDGCGLWLAADQRVGLAHRRLAIIDLSESGAQPMSADDGSLGVVFNGEIYNYRELRRELEGRGCLFRSWSDTEVLLHLYREWGPAMVERLRGMYAFAIWDQGRRGMFLARDPFGIKPLYYSLNSQTLRFASQVKALLAGGAVDRRPEPAGHAGFFLWGYVPEPYTLYRGIRALPAGATLWLEADGTPEIREFGNVCQELAALGQEAPPPKLTREERGRRLQAALTDTVAHHLLADVPVGVFLSAGLDSSVLTAMASESRSDLRSFTLGFKELQGGPRDETILAARTARHYHTRHQTSWISREDFHTDLPRILEAMDQPSIDGVNTYFVAREAAATGLKVALSGLGGDELFGGYSSFREIPRIVKTLAVGRRVPGFGRGCRGLLAPFLKRFTSPKYAGLLEYGGTHAGAYLLRRSLFMPWELPELLGPAMAREGWEELQTLARLEETLAGIEEEHLRVSALEIAWYMRNQLLRDADWAGMAHSLEIRVPLVDLDFFRQVLPLLGSQPLSKREMTAAVRRPLPEELLKRPKSGFSPPVNAWLRESSRQAPLHRERGLRGWALKVYRHFNGVQAPLARL